jgi:lipoprotein-anchoring transpeptidase ErfK/SrfK
VDVEDEEITTRVVPPAVVSVLLILFTLASLAVILFDYFTLPMVSKGVTLVGHDVSGMTAAQVRTSIDQYVAAPAMQPVMVTGPSASWSLDPKGIVNVDADAMVEQAYAPVRNATLLTRVVSRISGSPLPGEVKPTYTVATETLAAWVDQIAAQVDTEPVDATRTVVKYAIRIKHEVMGATVDKPASMQTLSAALTGEAALSTSSRAASLPVELVAPKVRASSFKRSIVVSLRHTKVYLYNYDKLVKTYLCAPGQPAWPTPKGDFVIIRKQKNAPWINPGSAWAASMPHSIPGGPGNPMGDRKIGINYPGVFLHGIPPSEYSSIGTHASHGCMRMMPSSIHDLFPRVKIGDPVFIRS